MFSSDLKTETFMFSVFIVAIFACLLVFVAGLFNRSAIIAGGAGILCLVLGFRIGGPVTQALSYIMERDTADGASLLLALVLFVAGLFVHLFMTKTV